MVALFTFAQSLSRRLQRFGLVIATLFITLQAWLLGVAPAHATGVYDLPMIKSGDPTLIVDQANILSRLTKGSVIGELEQLNQQTGNEVRFVTVHRLDYGETIESLTNTLFETWFPTSEDQANQTLLVLDNVTNSAAIRTGDRVKTIMPDEIADSVAQETLLAPIRDSNKYNQAVLDAGDRLVAVLSGQPDPGPPIIANTVQTEGTFAKPEETKESNATVWVIGLLAAATIIPMATYYLYLAIQS